MSNWKKSPFRSSISLRDRWPVEQDLIDPWAGDEYFYPFEDPKFYASLYNHEALNKYIENAKLNGYKVDLKHDDSTILNSTELCSIDLLANLTEDWIPDIAIFAEERVLGPFAPNSGLRKLCGAVLCFSPLLNHGLTAAGRFADTQRSSFSKNLGIQAKSPCMIWEKTEEKQVKPMLPLANQYLPQEDVSNLPESAFFIARICPTIDGWQASCVLPIPIAGIS